MKYIRTKDSIKAYSDICDLSYVYQSVGGIKVADTIEELCDYIVYNEYAENGNGKLIFKKISADWVKEQLKNVMLDGGGNIKLAILTDKGLIYVAKMNEDGILCLI